MVRVVHYINQFFGQIGGEDKAGVGPSIIDGAIGPGMLIDRLLRGRGKVVASAICGDNYFAEKAEAAATEVVDLIEKLKPDVLVAGPAFDAGRYGLACGRVCKAVGDRMGIPTITGMFPENPGAGLYRRHVFIIETARSAVGMSKAMPRMVDLACKILKGERPGKPEEEGYIPRGFKENIVTDTLAAERAINLLLKKMRGETVASEISVHELGRVAAASPGTYSGKARLTPVAEGRLTPKGDPGVIRNSRRPSSQVKKQRS